MATLIPISTTSQTTDKGQLEYTPDEGWHSWTPEEQGGILAASILVFLFLFGLTLFVSLRVPKRHKERKLADTERRFHERRQRSDTLPRPQPSQTRYTHVSAARGSCRQRATKRFSSDEGCHFAPDRRRGRRRVSTGRSYVRERREQPGEQRSQSCPSPRYQGPLEGRETLSGENSHWDRRRRPCEGAGICDGSHETLERWIGSDSTYSYTNGDPGPSTRKGKERMSRHQRHQSEGIVRIKGPPRHMRSYSVG
ncbi:hypothetical protein ACJ72_03250 [Emergomyces africanus]|uniref:Uncharacterized protein n=1 Tax=Emergomyces africanus TaxID=1955775 RepID=A0A1B7P076_9EURO|nr:hypothetical protein ACJ72_03250 [Emergomyces africanus]